MWETLKKVNHILDEAESLLGEEFLSRYLTKFGPIDQDSVTVIITDRGNGFWIASVTFSLNDEPSQIADQFRRVLQL
jgi:hypothetical protein